MLVFKNVYEFSSFFLRCILLTITAALLASCIDESKHGYSLVFKQLLTNNPWKTTESNSLPSFDSSAYETLYVTFEFLDNGTFRRTSEHKILSPPGYDITDSYYGSYTIKNKTTTSSGHRAYELNLIFIDTESTLTLNLGGSDPDSFENLPKQTTNYHGLSNYSPELHIIYIDEKILYFGSPEPATDSKLESMDNSNVYLGFYYSYDKDGKASSVLGMLTRPTSINFDVPFRQVVTE